MMSGDSELSMGRGRRETRYWCSAAIMPYLTQLNHCVFCLYIMNLYQRSIHIVPNYFCTILTIIFPVMKQQTSKYAVQVAHLH